MWDGENRLISLYPQVPAEGDKQCDFYYDYMGRRMLSLGATYVNNAWQYEPMEWYIYDGWNVVMVVNVDDTSIIRKYTWGLDLSNSIHGAGGIGGLLAAEEPQTTGESKKYWYLYDGNGNVGQLLRYRTSPSETVTLAAHYEYDPYGNTLVVADVDSSGLANDNPIRFSTKWLIDQPGVAYDLYYYGYRYYLTWMGRWTSKDPAEEGGGLNLLVFVRNTPLAAIDALGLDIMETCILMDMYTPDPAEKGPQPEPLSIDLDLLAILEKMVGDAGGSVTLNSPEVPLGVYGPIQIVASISGKLGVKPCCDCNQRVAFQGDAKVTVKVSPKLLGTGHVASTSAYGRLPSGEKVGRNCKVKDAAGNTVKCKDLKVYHNEHANLKGSVGTTFKGLEPCKRSISGSVGVTASVTVGAYFGFTGTARCEWRFPGGSNCTASFYAGYTGKPGLGYDVTGYGTLQGQFVFD